MDALVRANDGDAVLFAMATDVLARVTHTSDVTELAATEGMVLDIVQDDNGTIYWIDQGGTRLMKLPPTKTTSARA